MLENLRALALLAQLARGLLRHGEERTARQLGDRTLYIGLSDVGRAITCPRAAVASKLGLNTATTGDDIIRWLNLGDDQRITDTLRRQLVLQRGHWLEAGIEGALKANGVNLIPQLEIYVPDADVPIRAHLDFTLTGSGKRRAVRVLELKSTERLPQTLYAAYEAQLYGQIGLLDTLWDRPAFSVKDDSGKYVLERRTFPEVCRHLFGISMPSSAAEVDLEGWVLCLSMSEARAFGPYRPDAGMLALCRRTAESLWKTVQAVKTGRLTLDDVETCSGFHPLCAWCDHATGCPKFTADPVADPIMDGHLVELAKLKADKAALDTEIESREERIRQFCRLAGKPTSWLSTSHFRFRTAAVPGRKTIDPARLRAELTNHIGEVAANELLGRATIEGASYERLTVTAITALRHRMPRDNDPGRRATLTSAGGSRMSS